MARGRISPREVIERERLTKELANDAELRKLWISERVLRLAEYQDVVERVNEQIAELRDVEENPNPFPEGSRDWQHYEDFVAEHPRKPQRIPAMLLKMKIEALRTAAEELGQLPNDLPPVGDAHVYSVIGIAPKDLDNLR